MAVNPAIYFTSAPGCTCELYLVTGGARVPYGREWHESTCPIRCPSIADLPPAKRKTGAIYAVHCILDVGHEGEHRNPGNMRW